jgi:hypothetical protein
MQVLTWWIIVIDTTKIIRRRLSEAGAIMAVVSSKNLATPFVMVMIKSSVYLFRVPAMA